MREPIRVLCLRLVKALNVVLMAVPLGICWNLYYLGNSVVAYRQSEWLIFALFIAFYCLFARVYDAFLVSLNRISEMVFSQCLAVLLTDSMVVVIIWLLSPCFPNIFPMIAVFSAQILISVLWSTAVQTWYFRAYAPYKTAIVYDMRQGLDSLIREHGLEKKFDIQFSMEAAECIRNLSVLDPMEAVFVSGVHSHDRNVILKYCTLRNIRVYVLPRIGDVLMSGAKEIHMLHLPVLQVGRFSPKPEYTIAKRLFDIVSSAAVLLVVSPIMLVTALAIKLTDGGPVLYKQNRLTKDGKVFRILKFRSMRVDAEKDGIARLSTGDKDDRITPVGRFIRKFRIDELPQLLNILAGSMSVVGPRPERPEIARQYEEDLPEFSLRLQVKAGLTGYAQVYGKYNTTPYDKLQMDLMYIANPGFFVDLRIVFATLKILFVPESTEGVAEGQTTAAGKDATKQEEEVGV